MSVDKEWLDYRLFHGEPSDLRRISAILNDALAFQALDYLGGAKRFLEFAVQKLGECDDLTPAPPPSAPLEFGISILRDRMREAVMR